MMVPERLTDDELGELVHSLTARSGWSREDNLLVSALMELIERRLAERAYRK